MQESLAIKPLSANKLVLSLFFLLSVGLVGSVFLEYSKKEHVPGYLQTAGGDLRVIAPMRGLVEYKLTPGTQVKAGEVLLVLKNPARLPGGRLLQQTQEESLLAQSQSTQQEGAATAAAVTAKLGALMSQRALASDNVRKAEEEATTRKQFLELEQRRHDKQKELKQQGFLSAMGLEQSEAALLSKVAELQNAERAVVQAKTVMASLDAEIAATRMQQAGQGRFEREAASLEQSALEMKLQGNMEVPSQLAGYVTTLGAANGDTVEAGQLLAKIAPSGRSLEALLLLPPTSVGRIKAGQTVSLQLAAFPFQSYGLVKAELISVEASPVLSDETPLRSAGVSSGSFVVKATAKITEVPDKMGGLEALKNGMQLKAAIEIERKSFLRWMAGPLLKHFE